MNWLPSGLALAALLSISGVSSTSSEGTVASPDNRCTAADVQRVAHHFYDFANDWTDDGSAQDVYANHLFVDCQFRLYDNNDPEDNPDTPEIPHVFAEDEYFLGGVANWLTDAELEAAGFTRAEGIAYLKTLTDRFFWGPATTTDAQLQEIKVATTPYLDNIFAEEQTVGNHRYIVFKANRLDPGDYKWRFERTDENGTFATYGAVTITPAG